MPLDVFLVGLVCGCLAVNVFVFIRFERLHGKGKL